MGEHHAISKRVLNRWCLITVHNSKLTLLPPVRKERAKYRLFYVAQNLFVHSPSSNGHLLREKNQKLFMTAVGILFAPLAPLVTLAAATVFWLCSWIYKYQLVFMFVTRVETGGVSFSRLKIVTRELKYLSSELGTLLLIVYYFLLYLCRSYCSSVRSLHIFLDFLLISFLAVALQVQFRSLIFLATIPPLITLLLFKHLLNKKFINDFQYYVPRQQDLSRSTVHTENSDAGVNKLEQRYCHPALQAELLTPMVHSRAMSLLRRNLKGKKSQTAPRGSDRHKDCPRGVGEGSKIVKERGMEDEDEALDGVVFTPVHEVGFFF